MNPLRPDLVLHLADDRDGVLLRGVEVGVGQPHVGRQLSEPLLRRGGCCGSQSPGALPGDAKLLSKLKKVQ